MHTVQEAIQIINQYTFIPKSEKVSTTQCAGRILAEDVYASIDVPHFNQSAVDGFAIVTKHYTPNKKYQIEGEIKAGDTRIHLFNSDFNLLNSCIKIYTGSLVPKQYDAVIMKEHSQNLSNNHVLFTLPVIKFFQNIRKKGEEVKKDELIFEKHSLLKPEHLAVLATIGRKEVRIFKNFAIYIIATGNELKKLGSKSVKAGEKYETNGIMIQHLLHQYFGIQAKYTILKDNKTAIYEHLKNAMDNCNIIITTGGISVGDYDFTKLVIQELGFKILVDKVAQKPGQPFLFAIKKDKVLFGLPGNPRAALSCFYWYILRYIRKSYGLKEDWLFHPIQMELHQAITINDNKARILFANIENNKIRIPEKQDSHMLISSAKADAIVLVETNLKKGEKINVYLLK